ncbi:hypothetical protein R3W88_025782 [Solanum pinnatisectum]|uniref:Small EDRK-rich factor-like N-terminal domain-containing protein n=1 Tax=Solanum pinnatisectum TaxID=50273 RepID=A0AAV9M6F6_9SOLN|nr:hypothetical protein R3W88_025782 [Solanum pinnatisectum]
MLTVVSMVFRFEIFHDLVGVWNLIRFIRGNQREKDRERAAARAGKGKKGPDDGLTPEQRRERDAKALQEKAAKKAAKEATGGSSAGTKDTKK